MKFLGRGWQYTVYDIGNGRVAKRYNTWLEAYCVMLKDSLVHVRLPVVFFSRYYYAGRAAAAASLEKIKAMTNEQWMFGNPHIVDTYTYEQDCAEPLATHLERMTLDDGKQTIDKFVVFARQLASLSMVEKNFNVGDNFGLNSSGQVILIDIGEIVFAQEEIDVQLAKRVWAAPDVLSRIPNVYREYFIKKMDEEFVHSINTHELS